MQQQRSRPSRRTRQFRAAGWSWSRPRKGAQPGVDGQRLFTPTNPVMAEPAGSAPAAVPRSERLGPMAVCGLVLGALVLFQAIFTLSTLGALHNPKPHQIPLGVTASVPSAANAVTSQLNSVGAGTVLARTVTLAQANADLHARRLDGVLSIGPAKADILYVASAASPTESALLTTALGALDAGQHRTLKTVDVVPLPASDSGGHAVDILVSGWVLCGILGAFAIGALRGDAARGRRFARIRIAGFAGYALACSAVSTVITAVVVDIHPGQLPGALVGGFVVVFATACVTAALQGMLGAIGLFLVLVLFLAIGDPASGGLVPSHLLPTPWREFGPYLVNGAGVDLLRNLLYFGHRAVARPLLVLVVWAGAGVGFTVLAADREQRRQEILRPA